MATLTISQTYIREDGSIGAMTVDLPMPGLYSAQSLRQELTTAIAHGDGQSSIAHSDRLTTIMLGAGPMITLEVQS